MRATLYCVVWYLSILAGYVVLWAPTLPLLLLHRPAYRRITDVLATIWESFNVTLISTLLGVKVRVSGDALRTGERALVVCNHRTRLDWNYVWSGVFHAGWPTAGHNLKLVLKDQVKGIPGIGWIMQMVRCLYLKREWKTDESRISRMVQHWAVAYKSEDDAEVDGRPFQLLLFPEGTDLTPETRAKSDKFAEQNNRQKLKHVLHPRATGFTFLVEEMTKNNCLDAIYDVTLAYKGAAAQTEKEFFHGEGTPEEVCFHFRRIDIKQMPNTVIGLDRWLQECWAEKEKILASFHGERQEDQQEHAANSMTFNVAEMLRQGRIKGLMPLQYLSLASWLFFLWWFLTSFLLSWSGLLWTVAASAVAALASTSKVGGFHEIEALMERRGAVKATMDILLGKAKQD